MSRIDNHIRKAVSHLLEGVGLVCVVVFTTGLGTALNRFTIEEKAVVPPDVGVWQALCAIAVAAWLLWIVPMRLFRPFMSIMDRVELGADRWIILRRTVEAGVVRAAIVATLFLPILVMPDPLSQAVILFGVVLVLNRFDRFSVPATLRAVARALPA